MIYLATQYSNGNKEYNYAIAMQVQAHLMKDLDEVIYSPIVSFHNLAATFDLPHNYAYWQNYNRQMLAISNKVYFVLRPGFLESVGMKAEYETADKFGLVMFKVMPTHLNTWDVSELTHNPWES